MPKKSNVAILVDRLSVAQRDELIRHVAEGPQQIVVAQASQRGRCVGRLIELKLLIGNRPFRPSLTYLTTDGREATAIILAQYADSLVESGIIDRRPLDLAEKVKARAAELRERTFLEEQAVVLALREG